MATVRLLAFVMAACLAVLVSAQAPEARTVGQVIDDAAITAQIKAKLTADKLSNVKDVEVKVEEGFVTLNGTVDSFDRAERAVQIASAVKGVRGIVNNLHVAGTTVEPTVAQGDVTGVIAYVDPASGTITLQDGRVLRAGPGTVIWQVGSVQTVRPGTQVFVRGAQPLGVQPSASTR